MEHHTTEEEIFECIECGEFELNYQNQTLVCWKCIKTWRNKYVPTGAHLYWSGK